MKTQDSIQNFSIELRGLKGNHTSKTANKISKKFNSKREVTSI